jgi:hypothetical protein
MTLDVTPEARQVLAEWLARDTSRRALRPDNVVIVHDAAVVGGFC